MTHTRRQILQYGLAAGAGALMAGDSGASALFQDGAPATSAPAKSLNLLFLGGTGFIGPHQVEYAKKRGHKISLFNRGRTNPGLFSDLEKFQGDRMKNDYASLRKAIESGRKWDCVIDNSAYFPREVRETIAAVKGAVDHYIFVSTVSVYGPDLKPGSDESAAVATIPDPNTEKLTGESYGALKALCEQAAEAGMPGKVANLRPTLIVGPGDETDRFTYWPVRVDRGGPILAPGDGADTVQIIDARDFAEWCIHVAEARTVGVYNAAGPGKTLTMKEMLLQIGAGIGKTPELVWADTEFLTKHNVSAWQDMPVWIPRSTEESAQSRVSNAKAIKAGLKFRPVSQTAKDTIEWLKTRAVDTRPRRGPKPGLTPEREAELLKLLKERGESK